MLVPITHWSRSAMMRVCTEVMLGLLLLLLLLLETPSS